MRIAGLPFKKTKNPYQILLYRNLQAIGNAEVFEFSIKDSFLKKFNILHIHWPESNKLRKSFVVATGYVIVFNLAIYIAKKKGAKVVWTVHNIQPHENKFPKLEKLFFNWFTRLIDGVIVMNSETIAKCAQRYPVLRDKPFKMILHGHYKDWYSNTITENRAREIFGLKSEDKVFLILGQIRPYKGIENLILFFKKIPNKDYKLIIAGKADPNNDYINRLIYLLEDDLRITLVPQFITDDSLQNYFKAANIVVLPYNNLLNSGVLFLSLSFNTPVLVHRHDAIKELKKEYTENWIIDFEKLDENVLINAMKRVLSNNQQTLTMADRNWDKIAYETLMFFNELVCPDNNASI